MGAEVNKQKCWKCEWAAGKDEKCPWACKFEPVPGWKATPTKVNVNDKYVDSFDIEDCPMFELMTELKQRIVAKAGKVNNYRKEKLAIMKKLRFEENKTMKEIAKETGYSLRNVYRILKKE